MAYDEQMTPIRVVIAHVAGITRHLLVHVIRREQDMVLVGTAQSLRELLTMVDSEVDVLILGTADLASPPGICSHLLNEFPHLRILALVTSADNGKIYWLGLHQQMLENISLMTLPIHIRQAYNINQTF